MAKRRWTGRPVPVRPVLIAGVCAVLVLAGLCGWWGQRLYAADRADRLEGLLVAGGRQAATDLTSIDYRRAEADVRRILGTATGTFRDQFAARSGSLVDVVRKTQSTSVGTVSAAGLESVDGRSGRVLVALTVTTSSLGLPAGPPRYLRMRLTVVAQDGGTKVSAADYV